MGLRQSKSSARVTKPRTIVYSSRPTFTRNVETLPKKKRERISQKTRASVWSHYHGSKTVGVCYCCGIAIQKFNGGWQCSHVKADSKGGEETLDNLRTCCSHCNLSMGDQNLYVYIRMKRLSGPGAQNVDEYLNKHSSQINDRRTNNWRKKSEAI